MAQRNATLSRRILNVVIVIGVLCAIMIPSSFIYKRFYNVANPNAMHQEFNDSQDPDYKDQEMNNR